MSDEADACVPVWGGGYIIHMIKWEDSPDFLRDPLFFFYLLQKSSILLHIPTSQVLRDTLEQYYLTTLTLHRSHPDK